ncbi:TrbC/VirB2 family protein [Aurantiacibacter sp. D1-12]|uniref:TrbC/VirB2 family protein n=1 Tax=Aurantiacibacter sp. D1-12 TaxID=2993658 RepID=UPI00237CE49C|nr:TrbC/VirB2 family protein [Aurantiacibacter sp. D1-12]MDE1466111.1 TrbC/VirB2 family protein [Aurantiacibacter sp. D1-12]
MFTPSTNSDPVTSSIGWITDTLLGQLAVTLCVLAVAFVGFSMLTGRISLRRGAQVVLGCFLLLGSPLIAASMMGMLGPSEASQLGPTDTVVYEAQPREPLPEATYNPYANASLGRRPAD